MRNEKLEDFIFIELDKEKQFYKKYQKLEIFFEFLKKNKISFEINKEFEKEEYILIKILTLNPKYFMLIFNNHDSRNFLVDYEVLKRVYKEQSRYKKYNISFYFIFLEESLTSLKDIFSKSFYVDLKRVSIEKNNERLIKKDIKISLKKYIKQGLPLGFFNEKNKLNDLTGKEWIKFTKSWFVHNPPPRKETEILHPAKFPESLIEEFILFFTKKGQIVLDPFIGTGSTAVAAKNTLRSCIGIEINKKYADIAKKRLTQKTLVNWKSSNENNLFYRIITDDSNNIEIIWKKNEFPLADFCITSPPYWNQLERNYIRQEKRKE
ncbi:MAG: DNA methyltransferase [Promethearchaeota archaeon]